MRETALNRHSGIYESLGVTPVINAAGTFTDLGGSRMSPQVIAAWTAAAQEFVDLAELQDCVGRRIAELLKVPAALVTGGAAAGILLGVAAAITTRDPAFVQRQVNAVDDQPFEVLRQKCHRDLYDRQIETCGVRIVEVETISDVGKSVSSRTVLMHACNYHEQEGAISHHQWLELAKHHQLPTLLDAAADVPPVENLWRFNQLGYDMVTFSGGKAIGGPQSSGLLLGGKRWIEAAKQNAVPQEGTIGRVAKVSKEDIVALWRALQLFVIDGDQIPARCQRQLQVVESMLQAVDNVSCQWITPPVANHFPHLRIDWDVTAVGMTAAELADQLRTGTPPIATDRVYGTGDQGLLISAINLAAGQERLVAKRLIEVFQSR